MVVLFFSKLKSVSIEWWFGRKVELCFEFCKLPPPATIASKGDLPQESTTAKQEVLDSSHSETQVVWWCFLEADIATPGTFRKGWRFSGQFSRIWDRRCTVVMSLSCKRVTLEMRCMCASAVQTNLRRSPGWSHRSWDFFRKADSKSRLEWWVKTEALCGQVQRLPRLQHGVWGGLCWWALIGLWPPRNQCLTTEKGEIFLAKKKFTFYFQRNFHLSHLQ